MISRLEFDRRRARLAALQRAPADLLTDADHAELRRLEQWEDGLCRALPRQIANARYRLQLLHRHARSLGLA